MIRIANAQLWVHDQDEALAFYTEKVGLEVRADVTLAEMGDFRWLTVGPAGQDDFSIVLMAIPGPPVMDPATADEVRNLTARVVEDIDREGRPAARVGLKVRYRPFITVSRSLTLPVPTNDPALLADAAVSLLERVEHDRPVRLLGVRLEMVEPEGGYAR